MIFIITVSVCINSIANSALVVERSKVHSNLLIYMSPSLAVWEGLQQSADAHVFNPALMPPKPNTKEKKNTP